MKTAIQCVQGVKISKASFAHAKIICRKYFKCALTLNIATNKVTGLIDTGRKSDIMNYLANEFNIFSLNIFDDHYLHLGKEVQCKITDCIPNNTVISQ